MIYTIGPKIIALGIPQGQHYLANSVDKAAKFITPAAGTIKEKDVVACLIVLPFLRQAFAEQKEWKHAGYPNILWLPTFNNV